jgi:hypothetical protein
MGGERSGYRAAGRIPGGFAFDYDGVAVKKA